MARLIAGFGTSHSPMLACAAEDWTSSFLPRDKARQHYDFGGRPCRYDDILAMAPADAMDRIAPAAMAARRAEIDAAQERLRESIAAAALDALIVIGDDQEELFDHTNMPAIGVPKDFVAVCSIENLTGTTPSSFHSTCRYRMSRIWIPNTVVVARLCHFSLGMSSKSR